MSRTYRKKRESYYSKYLSKQFSYGSDIEYLKSGEPVPEGWKEFHFGGRYSTQFICYARPLTKEEFKKELSKQRRESSNANERSPGKFYRLSREKRLRSHNKRELTRWIKNPDSYEDMCKNNPDSCLWDWS